MQPVRVSLTGRWEHLDRYKGQWDIRRRFLAGTWAFRVGLELRLEPEVEKEL